MKSMSHDPGSDPVLEAFEILHTPVLPEVFDTPEPNLTSYEMRKS
ncbi:MAG: hypothetical protein ACM3SR_13240 [Ignavibacteriales bacterium]